MESDDRLDLESALARRRASSAFDTDTVAELESHLRDAFESSVALGLAPAKAFREALAELGDPAQIASEFSKIQKPRSSKIMNTSILKSPRLRRIARNLIIAIAIALPVRAFAVERYIAVGTSVAPEVPSGAHVLAWRIARKFAPGDIAVYRQGDHAFLGRVTGLSATGIVVARNNQQEQAIARDEIIGRVILTTR